MIFFRKWKKAGLVVFSAISIMAHADVPRRSLDLELGEVEGGIGYEIEVTRILETSKRKPPVNFKIKSTKWSATLVPGKYQLRVRSLDGRGVPGDWGPPQDLVVKLPAVPLLKPENGSDIKSDDPKFEKVEFSWKPIEGAEKYKIKIFNGKGQSVQESLEKNTDVKFRLPVAAEYTWQVTPVMIGELEGDVTLVPPKFSISGPRLESPGISPVDDINTTQIIWTKNEVATKYEYCLEVQTKTGEWHKVEDKTLDTPKHILPRALPSGHYRVTIKALADLRKPSESVVKEFKTQYVGPRSPAAIEQVRSEGTFESKSLFFAFASYYVSLISYSGNNLERGSTGTATSFDAIGGTGRLGAGTWLGDQTNWGLLATTDISGFTIQDPVAGPQTFTYLAASLQGIYRMRVGALGQLRFTLGPQYRELPVTIGSIDGTQYASAKVTTLGPLAGVALYHGFHQRFGVQLNAQAMDSVVGLSVPAGGGSNNSQLSYQLGILGSMGIAENLLGFLGYAYKIDQASYVAPGANTTQGIQNYNGSTLDNVSISGHYFNLMLEYGF